MPMYLRLWDSLLKKREMVVVAESMSDYEGNIMQMHFKHWYTKAYPMLMPASSALFNT